MPTYDMRNVKTGEVKTMVMKIAEKEALVEEGEWEHVISSVRLGAISQHGSTLSKTSSDWRNHLDNIKKTSGRGNTIKTF